jgi:cation:H+ antiporter
VIWLQFLGCSILIVLAAIKLAEYGDVIALRTRLGGLFIGTLLLAAATSLPELLTTVSALGQGAPNLAAGGIFGSCMFNMFMLAVLDLFHWQQRILRRVATKHALTAGLAMLLTGMAVFFMLADIDLQVGWVGLDSLCIVGAYVVGVRLIQRSGHAPAPVEEASEDGAPSLLRAGVGFVLATAVLVVVSPWLVQSSVAIADVTGLGTGFVGTALLAVVTSLPELVTTLAAARLGAYDLAVGNLFGSNMFNMFILGLTDVFFTQGRFLAAIHPAFALAGLLALLLTGLGLIGNLARLERRLLLVEIDALLLILVYSAGLWLLYSRGIGL